MTKTNSHSAQHQKPVKSESDTVSPSITKEKAGLNQPRWGGGGIDAHGIE